MSNEKYHSLNYNHETINALLEKIEKNHVLTEEQFIQLRDTVRFVTDFDGDYEKLHNKPQIPTNISQLKNDVGYSVLSLESIRDWVEALINEAELNYEDNYVNQKSLNTLFNAVYEKIEVEINSLERRIETFFASKDDLKNNEYELEEHKHSPKDIKSCIQNENFYTLVDDLEQLSNEIASYRGRIDRLLSEVTGSNKKIKEMENAVKTFKCHTIKQVDNMQMNLSDKADKNHIHEDIENRLNELKESSYHINKTVLDTIDSGNLDKWNATTSFVGNILTLNLGDAKREGLLDIWKTANSRITTTNVGGIPTGTDLRGKTIYEILKMMLFEEGVEEDKEYISKEYLEDYIKNNCVSKEHTHECNDAKSVDGFSFWHGTQEEYDNIGTKDPKTVYMIKEK